MNGFEATLTKPKNNENTINYNYTQFICYKRNGTRSPAYNSSGV